MSDSTRKSNWSAGEISLLVDLVSERKDVLRGRFSPALTSADKAGAWEAIATSINAIGGNGHTTKEVKKRQDIQSSTKKKEVERKRVAMKTGGGPPPEDIKDWEKRIIEIISDKDLYGIDTLHKACSESARLSNICSTSAQAVIPRILATETEATCSTPTSAEGSTEFEPGILVINTRKTLEDQEGSKRSKYEKQSSRKQKHSVEDTFELLVIQREMLEIMREDVAIKRRMLASLEELVTLKKIKLDRHLEEQAKGPTYFEL
ncbi:myb/SANT-like DNA-binding domain-containing protein 4 [Saccostrea echinata]|uniref:myb/SANT-like DNA-binding domain-containing protein 4 n=1 Tax=Saccostrea echinata TaxID=191078 RepID=UPI002A80EBD9|nr:myb/SANT-like DNA-binding domain-containing protein 4 [Saccostrea echinata]